MRPNTHSLWLYTSLVIQKRNAVLVIAWILVRMVKSMLVYLLKLRRMAMTGHTHRTEKEKTTTCSAVLKLIHIFYFSIVLIHVPFSS